MSSKIDETSHQNATTAGASRTTAPRSGAGSAMTVQMCTARAATTPGTRDNIDVVRPRASTGARSDVAPSSKRERPTPRTARRRRGDSADDPDASDADASEGMSSDDDDVRRDRWEAKRRRREAVRSARRDPGGSSFGEEDDRRDGDDDAFFDPATEGTAGPPCVLRLEYWMRSEACTARKRAHVAAIDASGGYWGMEDHIERTVFRRVDARGGETSVDVALEPNMFPYECPPGVTHWTLWSREEMSPAQICAWTKTWLRENAPGVTKWNFDMNDNNSVDVPHYHVFLFEPPGESAPGKKEDGDAEKRAETTRDATTRTRREQTRRPRTPSPFGDEAQEPEK